jgi:hypothetical protein
MQPAKEDNCLLCDEMHANLGDGRGKVNPSGLCSLAPQCLVVLAEHAASW